MSLNPRYFAPAQLGTWRWTALLLFALVTPIGLPSSQTDRRCPEYRRRHSHDPLLSCSDLTLYAAPDRQAPVLGRIPSGEPLSFLRGWTGKDGRIWIQAKLNMPSGSARRGWIAWDHQAGA